MGEVVGIEKNIKQSPSTPNQYQPKESNKRLIKYRYEDNYSNLVRYYQKIMFDVYYNEFMKCPKKTN
ncbi:hypothetical protein [Fredinandcohnia sp. 179-A 10B2 NHS]|uniref:hypothetical protein n=1 Tax=Fredinandcohnia sp. 179-A 10B2 NHS TaxID=3235176 RepID=UPI0039A10D22